MVESSTKPVGTKKIPSKGIFFVMFAILVEHTRLELVTPTLPVLCAPSCANAPCDFAILSRKQGRCQFAVCICYRRVNEELKKDRLCFNVFAECFVVFDKEHRRAVIQDEAFDLDP